MSGWCRGEHVTRDVKRARPLRQARITDARRYRAARAPLCRTPNCMVELRVSDESV